MFCKHLYNKGNASIKDRTDFQSELETMKRIGRHRNVVSLIGACDHEGKVWDTWIGYLGLAFKKETIRKWLKVSILLCVYIIFS